MCALRRFPLTYDDAYDKDILLLLQSTPDKRRSERIRQLIRLGLKAEASQEVMSVTPPKVTAVVPSEEKSKVLDTLVNDAEPTDSVHKDRRIGKVHFAPPKS